MKSFVCSRLKHFQKFLTRFLTSKTTLLLHKELGLEIYKVQIFL